MRDAGGLRKPSGNPSDVLSAISGSPSTCATKKKEKDTNLEDYRAGTTENSDPDVKAILQVTRLSDTNQTTSLWYLVKNSLKIFGNAKNKSNRWRKTWQTRELLLHNQGVEIFEFTWNLWRPWVLGRYLDVMLSLVSCWCCYGRRSESNFDVQNGYYFLPC